LFLIFVSKISFSYFVSCICVLMFSTLTMVCLVWGNSCNWPGLESVLISSLFDEEHVQKQTYYSKVSTRDDCEKGLVNLLLFHTPFFLHEGFSMWWLELDNIRSHYATHWRKNIFRPACGQYPAFACRVFSLVYSVVRTTLFLSLALCMMLHHLTSGFENVAHFSLIPPTKNEENILRVDGWDDAWVYIDGKINNYWKIA
jgi:hypothetical protein